MEEKNREINNIEANNREVDKREESNAEEKEMSAVALRGLTILPGTVIHFDLNRSKSIAAVQKALQEDGLVFLVTQKNPDEEEPQLEDLFRAGCVAKVKQVSKLPNNIIRVLVEGVSRALLLDLLTDDEMLKVRVEEMPEEEFHGDGLQTENEQIRKEAMIRQLAEMFGEYGKYYPKVGQNVVRQFQVQKNLEKLIDLIAMNMPVDYQVRQRILGLCTVQERYDYLTEVLRKETEIAGIKMELSQKVRERVDKHQKEYVLREQLAYIRHELGEDGEYSDAEQFEEQLQKLKAGKEVKERIQKEITRLKNLNPGSSEYSVERAHLETLLEMPWDKASRDTLDLERAEQILEKEHYGLEQVKERILEFLAVRILNRHGQSPIICLVGPPGTGKTSIAASVAEALHKKYIRISLGGVRDEAEIRGHRKTYIGAMPGRIATALRQAGVKNPLMLLDEIDKVSNDYKSDTASALLEVLDGEQNHHFRDHYIEIPIDLSEVLFIATANSTATIPGPLLDRMELIEVNSYTENEKFHIARRHLIAKQWEKNGLSEEQLTISDNALRKLIDGYTREAGVRDLERKLGEICRKAAREFLKPGKQGRPIRITEKNLPDYLGNVKYTRDKKNETDQVGIVRGLAWTSVGGETLQVEVNMMPGKGEIELTGQMGDVMKESALIGMSYVRSVGPKYHIDEEIFAKNDFHIHIPEGAVPKDGPSAGITMATALISAITGIPVHADVAMTGENTLRGRVLPIGGLKEKLLAARMAGMRKVLVPEENRKDVEEISREIKGGMEIVFVKDMEQVLEHALVKSNNLEWRLA